MYRLLDSDCISSEVSFLSVDDLLKCLTMGTVAGLGIELVLVFTVGSIVNIVRSIQNV